MDKVSLIHIVLSGKASEEEKKELDDWISASKENRIEFDDLKLLLENTEYKSGDIGPEDQFYHGFRKIQAAMQTKWRKRKRAQIGVVAVILVLLGFLWLVTRLFPFSTFNHKPPTELRFDGSTLADIIDALKAEYHVEVSFDPKELSMCRFTGSFNRGNNFDDVLSTIAKALNLEFEGSHGKYKLSGKGC